MMNVPLNLSLAVFPIVGLVTHDTRGAVTYYNFPVLFFALLFILLLAVKFGMRYYRDRK